MALLTLSHRSPVLDTNYNPIPSIARVPRTFLVEPWNISHAVLREAAEKADSPIQGAILHKFVTHAWKDDAIPVFIAVKSPHFIVSDFVDS
jgi:hypothetical protein